MDSFADLQPVIDHHNHDINPPQQQFTSNTLHPPYSEMIIAAICALKDKDGSSRQAIAKYIEKEYTNLPPTHPTLLTHHLKNMKNAGELIMVKHSYMLPVPRSSVSPFQDHHFTDYSVANTSDNLFANANMNMNDNTISGENSMLTPRRKPGRPPKPRQDFGCQLVSESQLPAYQPQFEQNLGGVQGFQPQTNLGQQDVQSHYGVGDSGVVPPQEVVQGSTEPVFASLGLADESVAPENAVPENVAPENAVVVSAKRGRGRAPKSIVAAAVGSGEVVETEKRKRGRPKVMSVGGVRRGRPKRNVGSGPPAVPLSGDAAKPRGRPKRSATKPQTVPVANGAVETGSVSKGRGRPPRNKFRNLNSQSFGRPTKAGPGTAVIVTDPHQLVAYLELKSKYESLQSKAKEVVGVVRPYVNPDYEGFGALQELESLVG